MRARFARGSFEFLLEAITNVLSREIFIFNVFYGKKVNLEEGAFMENILSKEIKYVKGVGPNRAELLNKLGIYTLEDLITYYPRTYEDRSKPKSLLECVDGEEALIEVIAISKMIESKFAKKTMQRLMIRDSSSSAEAVWFNQTYLKNKFKIGEKYK